ncbi:MAG TPA: CDP-diacylglycerol--glycerol-3-phosphate 3-phosphatidyltransferase [Chthoniobacterales bacterium]|jgi:CDP-diacylglycerol--glycerol-3-phosphate 3-phosphatidyltransferase|nr:CDP-diacylglycerol--glycerol-3-phosphate 3-phosphatidyltransferase [Chthoniobacterales bacterium]
MTIPNQLTILRLALTVPFVAALSLQFPGSKLLAFGLFVASSFTDCADGYIARKYKQISDFGKLMDPLVDKIMTMSAFVCLVSLGSIPAWAVIVILSREFLITGLRMIAASRGKVLPAERLGKLKTVWQIVTILYLLLLVSVVEEFGGVIPRTTITRLNAVALILILLTVVLTLWSGAAYFAKNWDLVRDL